MMILKIILFFAILNACWLVWFIFWNPDKNPDRIIKGPILASIVGVFLAGIITFPIVFLIILSRKRGDKVKKVFFESVNADS